MKREIMLTKRMKEILPERGPAIVMLGLLIAIALFALPAAALPCDPVTSSGDTIYNAPGTIDPYTIPQFVNSLNAAFPPFGAPPVWVPTHSDSAKDQYVINVSEFDQQILPPVADNCNVTTTVWGYGGQAKFLVGNVPLGFVRNSPAGTFEAVKGKRVEVKWVNDLSGPSILPVDPTLHWADPNGQGMLYCTQSQLDFLKMMGTGIDCTQPYPPGYPYAQYPVPIVTHLHGAEVQSTSDGGPEQWFTNSGIHGADYATEKKTDPNAAIYQYPNEQLPTTLWYHDHALGMTRLNVLSGLAGFYLLRDPGKEPNLIADIKYEVPLAIQDRNFKTNGDLYFPTVGNSPSDHPYWNPEFFGAVIMVNGLVWPKMDVDQTTYRLRLLDGSNARFYHLQFIDGDGNPVTFYQVGSDGGYYGNPIEHRELTIAPGERADILINFTGVTGPVTVTNDAPYPYPGGADPVPELDGTIMRFDINNNVVPSPTVTTSTTLSTILPNFTGAIPAVIRNHVLFEVANTTADEPVMVLLNGQKWLGVLRTTPAPGTIEEWRFINPTADAHPMHTHLTQFQVIGRQAFDQDAYVADWIAKQYTDCPTRLQPCGSLTDATDSGTERGPPWPNTYSPLDLDVTTYLITGTFIAADPDQNQLGWKDTVQSFPGYVTTIRIRYATNDGTGHQPFYFPFNPTIGPGYVWHCHIVDHEDNEMMLRYKMVIAAPPGPVNKNTPPGQWKT
jgi:spore coat protein A